MINVCNMKVLTKEVYCDRLVQNYLPLNEMNRQKGFHWSLEAHEIGVGALMITITDFKEEGVSPD